MKTVGVRDLKNKLSEYLRRVRLGEGVLVTDRGEVVAELLPPGQTHGDPSVPTGLQALARQGLLTLGAPTAPAVRRLLGDAEVIVSSDLTLIECDRVLLRAVAL